MEQRDLQEIRDLIYQNKNCFNNTLKELEKMADNNLALYDDSKFSDILKSLKQISCMSDEIFNKIVEIYKNESRNIEC